MRLAKYLANSGFGTRKDVRALIRNKAVEINGQPIKSDSAQVDLTKDEVCVYGEVVEYIDKIYILLNKPEGYVSATKDNLHNTVIDLMPEYAHLDIFPVGRLDIDTTGVLLITNDGPLAHQLLSPKKHVNKTYEVTLKEPYVQEYTAKLEQGIELDDFTTLPAKVENASACVCHLTISEGKFHQVKRMFKALGNEVVKLERIKFANLTTGDLDKGQYILLKKEEINYE